MESVNKSDSEDTSAADGGGNTDTFQTVKSKKSSKRKRDQGEVQMESEDAVVPPKRPQFPPISGDKLKVTGSHSLLF